MKAYRIIKYIERHEDCASRRVKHLKYVQFPTSQESIGWSTLKAMPGGLEAGFVYTVLAELAGTFPIRGVLASDKRPYSLTNLAVLARLPIDAVKRAMELLMHEEIHFIDQIDWPIDPRLVRTTMHRGEIVSRIIEPWSVDASGQVLDYEGNVVHTAPDTPATEQKRSRNAESPVSHDEPSEDSDSDSIRGELARRKARTRWLAGVVKLFAPRASMQHRADATSARAMFDELIWPEGDSPEQCASRHETAMKLIAQAASRNKPMAWLTTAVKKISVTAAAR